MTDPLRSAALRVIDDRIAPIGLDDLNARAALQTRVDSKYLVTLAQLDTLVDRMATRLAILDIAGRQEQTYDTVYFDTAGVDCFHDHLQRRRLTYKLRSRVYVGSGLHVFEVKMRDGRGQTIKVKIDHADVAPDVIGAAATAFYHRSIEDRYGFAVTRDFEPSLRNRYGRITLASLEGPERTTVDHDLSFADPSGETVGRMNPGLVLIETKSATGRGLVDRALWALGVRPQRVSKYCIGVALVHPELRLNRYHRTLRTSFSRLRPAVEPTWPKAGPVPDPPSSIEDLPRRPRPARAPRPPRPARAPRIG